jgi:7,8-dihydropterin-6-yl-methyl-4-(beta-D-ribofuranosyl)aminobenzene 5'-phosphate synthase
MSVKITTLVDNTADSGCLAEWGLSILVEVDGRRVLLDTGASALVVHNARTLGVSLNSLDYIVLSHGHYDHTGGLLEVLKSSQDTRVVAHPHVWHDRYSGRRTGPKLNIGLPFTRDELKEHGALLELTTEPLQITPRLFLSGEVPLQTDFEQVDEGLFCETSRGVEPDLVVDELSLAVKTDEGLVVILGCAHRGPVNIIKHFKKIIGEERIYAVVGGMHLLHADVGRIEKTIEAFRHLGVERVACSHCTGPVATAMFAKEFKKFFIPNKAGTKFVFPC